MKIAMIGSWNADSGASIHAELIGRLWKEKGHNLKVYTFYRDSFHGTALTKTEKQEESYVTRCFTVSGEKEIRMDTDAILKEDFDIFIAQDIGMIPLEPLLEIFPQIKKKARTVNVIHDGELSKRPHFFDFDWDQVVCFDQRYYDFLKEAYPEDILRIIHYPAFPLNRGNKKDARKKLGLPQDKKIVFLFGQAAEYAVDTTLALDRISDRYNILLLVVTENKYALEGFPKIRPRVGFNVKIIRKFPDTELLYEYLYASDCMVYNKYSRPICVVASTAFQILGAGCPILARDSNYVYDFDKEVFKYRNFYELEECFIDVFEESPKYQDLGNAVEKYLEVNSAEPVAEKFLELFEELLNKKQ